jgi:hypothetical protein
MSEAIPKLVELRRQLATFDALGGRESFFGMKFIFELIVKEQHEKLDETGMYRYKGMEQYGNVVHPECLIEAIAICARDFCFTGEDFQKLQRWYGGRSIDCTVTAMTIALFYPQVLSDLAETGVNHPENIKNK